MSPHRCLVIVNVINGGAFIFVIKRRCDENSGVRVLGYSIAGLRGSSKKKDAQYTVMRSVFIYTS